MQSQIQVANRLLRHLVQVVKAAPAMMEPLYLPKMGGLMRACLMRFNGYGLRIARFISAVSLGLQLLVVTIVLSARDQSLAMNNL